MSNQRPASSPEFRKRSSSDTPTSAFSTDGVCDACRFNEQKANFDWEGRWKKLENLCDTYRRDDGNYDVIVPGSGGKDSIAAAWLLKEKLGMNPLGVTWAPHAYTEVGQENLEAWREMGLDHVLFTPNPLVHAKLTRLAFLNLVNPFQPFIIGQKMLAPRLAMKFGVSLVMYGENPAELHNKIGENSSPSMALEHFADREKKGGEEVHLGGVSVRRLHEDHGLSLNDLQPYQPLNRAEVVRSKIRVDFMSFYYNWSPQRNYYLAREVTDFRPNPDGRSEGTYSKYSSLDDKIDGQHYFTSLVKFGQGRAMNDACRDIRDGYITREEGVNLVRLYDLEFPTKYFRFFLEYTGLDEGSYWKTIDSARSPHLWEKKGSKWRLLHSCR